MTAKLNGPNRSISILTNMSPQSKLPSSQPQIRAKTQNKYNSIYFDPRSVGAENNQSTHEQNLYINNGQNTNKILRIDNLTDLEDEPQIALQDASNFLNSLQNTSY